WSASGSSRRASRRSERTGWRSGRLADAGSGDLDGRPPRHVPLALGDQLAPVGRTVVGGGAVADRAAGRAAVLLRHRAIIGRLARRAYPPASVDRLGRSGPSTRAGWEASLAVKVGVVGCGRISSFYLRIAQGFPQIEVVAVSDVLLDRARARAEEFGIARWCAPGELVADPEVEIVLNLTVPGAHAEVARAALEHGKHVYNEKPLAVELGDARATLALAE